MIHAVITDPTLVLVTGPPGTGKSTIAEAVATRLAAPVLAWDWAMAGLTPFAEIQSVLDRLERTQVRQVGWSVLRSLATAQLRNDRSAVLDGTARTPEIDATRRLADELGACCLVIATHCSDPAVHRARIEGRSRRIPGWYELDWPHVADFLAAWQHPDRVDLDLDAIDPLAGNLARLDRLLDQSRPSAR